MFKMLVSNVLLMLSFFAADSSASAVSTEGYYQPKVPETITKLRIKNDSQGK